MAAARNAPLPRSISDQLRDAIERSGRSQYDIAKQAGIHRRLISRFVLRERSLSLETVDALAVALNLQLCEGRRRPSPR